MPNRPPLLVTPVEHIVLTLMIRLRPRTDFILYKARGFQSPAQPAIHVRFKILGCGLKLAPAKTFGHWRVGFVGQVVAAQMIRFERERGIKVILRFL